MLRSSRARHRSLGSALLGALCVTAMLGAFALPTAAQDEGFAAYVDTTALNLRAAPGTKSNVVGIMLKYDRVQVLERTQVGRSTWYSIEASSGYTNGWVHGGYIAFGEAPAGIFPEGPVDYGAKETPTLIKGPWKYEGAAKCAECHQDSTGGFHLGASRVWQNHVHSSAYQSLKREYTREIAKRTRGIDDPLGDWRCVKCHVSAFGAPANQVGAGYSNEEGITCEVCHGPGGEYADRDHGPDVPKREAMGFRILADLTQRREVCTSCHNPASPTYKPFNLREFSRDIAHWADPGDVHYYADATTEAKRREAQVERARQKQAEQALAEKKKREAEARSAEETEKAQAAEEAEKQRLAALSAKDQAEAAARAAETERKAAEAEAQRLAAEEKAKEADERRKAEALLAQQKSEEADRTKRAEAARKRAEDQARAAAAESTGIEKYLEDVDDAVTMNIDGKKYNSLEFAHLAHASNQYLPDGTCQTCHHTQEDDESPEACNSCHEIGGEADEEKKKARAYHAKGLRYPKPEDQEQVSCVGCHKSQNELLAMGDRTGEKAPTKCTLCHTRKK